MKNVEWRQTVKAKRTFIGTKEIINIASKSEKVAQLFGNYCKWGCEVRKRWRTTIKKHLKWIVISTDWYTRLIKCFSCTNTNVTKLSQMGSEEKHKVSGEVQYLCTDEILNRKMREDKLNKKQWLSLLRKCILKDITQG